jgi:hypothetical protein
MPTPLNFQEKEQRIRAYLLGLLSEEEARGVEERVEDDPAWHDFLEEERASLEKVDALPESAPPEGLAAEALQYIFAGQWQYRTPLSGLSRPKSLVLAVVFITLAAFASSLLSQARSGQAQLAMTKMGKALRHYAEGSPAGQFPALAPAPDIFVPDIRVLFPDYLDNPDLLVLPGHPREKELRKALRALFSESTPDWDAIYPIVSESYFYLPWEILDDGDLEALVSAQDTLRQSSGQSVTVDGKAYAPLISDNARHRMNALNLGEIDRGNPSEVPLLFESPRGATLTVLFLDGGVEILARRDPLFRDLRKVLLTDKAGETVEP